MKLLFITTTSTTSHAFLMELADDLKKNGDEIEFAFNYKSFLDAPSKAIEIKNKGYKTHEIKFSRNINILKDIIAGIKLHNIIKSKNYDIVHSHTSKAGFISRIICKLNNQYNIHTSHDFYYRAYEKGIKRKIFILLERFASKFSNKIFFVSKAVLDSAIENNIAPSNKMVFVSNGIIPENNNNLTNFNINKKEYTVGVISRLVKNKSINTFIEAAKLIDKQNLNVKFEIIGKGPLEKELKNQGIELIKKNKLFFFNNIETRSELFKKLKKFDVFMFPTIREGLGIVILEALDAGVPVITTNLAPMNTIIQNNYNGYLCKKEDSDDFANACIKLLQDQETKLKFIKNGYMTVNSNFNLLKINKEIITIYKKILNE